MFPIHVASIDRKNYLFLRKEDKQFLWFSTHAEFHCLTPTVVAGLTVAHAIQSAYKAWQMKDFRLIHCGFRFVLPQRDPVGSNALFWQMALSYNSSNGSYFDEEAGHLCYVDFASQEALDIWKKIRSLKQSENTKA